MRRVLDWAAICSAVRVVVIVSIASSWLPIMVITTDEDAGKLNALMISS